MYSQPNTKLLSIKVVKPAEGMRVNTEITTLVTRINSIKPRIAPKKLFTLPRILIFLKIAVRILLVSLNKIFKRKNKIAPANKVQSKDATVEPAK